MTHQPQYFSGLNWRDALPLVGKLVEFSDNGEDWGKPRKLVYIHEKTASRRYESPSTYWEYIRTCPECHGEWEPVDNCIQITHYYAGYRVDGVPAMTENRKT